MSDNNGYPEIRSGTADTVLAGLWRIILKDERIDPARLDDLINQYSRKMTNVDAQTRTQWYGNVASDLKADQMTWRTFKRGPMVLGAKRMEITLILHHLNCRTRHKYVLHYPPPDQSEEIDTGDGGKQATELSIFYAQILMNLDVSVGTLNRLLRTYMQRRHMRITPANSTYMRGNLKKEIIGKRLSWASFVKGIDLLTVPRFGVEIALFYDNRHKKTTYHGTTITLNDIKDMLADMDESDFLQPENGEPHPEPLTDAE